MKLLSFVRGIVSISWRALIVLLLVLVQVVWQPVQEAVAAPAPVPAPIPVSRPQARPAFAPVASTAFSGLPTTQLLGQNVSFSVTFSNTGDATGYGPFIDLVIPASQGLGTTTITATYQGTSVDTFVNTFNGAGQTTHPLVRDNTGNFITVNAPAGAGPGDKLVTIRLPFGSYGPGQPPISVDVTVNMAAPPAQVGTPIPVWTRGGYQFGTTPLDDWCCDPPIVAPSWVSSTVTPILWTLTKTYSGPEDEAASGPNFTTYYPMQYTIAVDIAPGQTVSNLTLSDILPDNLQPVSWVNKNGATCSPDPLNTASPGSTIQCTFASASGHEEVVFDFYIPLTDSGGARVIDPATGLAVTSCNNASASGTWNATLVSTSTGTAPSTCGHTLNDRSIAIQKNAAVDGGGTLEPGAVIKNTLDFQVSDYFAFANVNILDIVSDGQHFFTDAGHPVTLQIAGNNYTIPATTIDTANYSVDCYYGAPGGPECGTSNPSNSGNPDQYGTTQLTFRVSDEIVTATSGAQNGKMIGGCVNPAGGSGTPDCGTYNDGPTTGEIIFYTQVLNNFVDDYPSGDSSVDQGDTLTNIGKHIQGDVLDTNTLNPVTPLSQPQDDTSASLTIALGSLSKSVYAINGSTSLPSPVSINPGDLVTYRLEYQLPVGNEENMRFTDYLPLPIFKVGDPAADGSVSSWTFSTTVGTMAAGTISLGPSDTFYNYMVTGTGGATGTASPTTDPSSSADPLYHDGTITPNLVVDTNTNSVSITYPNYDDTRVLARTVDLLVSVVVTNEPYADQLYLTNEAYSYEGSTNGGISSVTKIQQVVVNEPVIVTKKSAVWAGQYSGGTWTPQTQATYNPALPVTNTIQDPSVQPRWTGTITSAAPFSSDISHVDAGDIVTFMIVIEDQGHSDKGAFDIAIKDTLPSIFQVPTTPTGLNLHIYHGDGSGADYGSGPVEIQYTGLGGAPGGTTSPSGDLFGNGIQLVDPADASGVGPICQAETVGPGKNVIVITYDLEIKPGVTPGTYPNTAQNTSYASQNNGPNYVGAGGGSQDTANTTIDSSPSKYLTATSETFTTGADVTIGEIVRYRLVATIPQGSSPNFQLRDLLPVGLTFLNDGTATFAFVSNNGITTSDATLNGMAACNLTGTTADGTSPPVPAGCNLPDVNVSSSASTNNDTYNTGTDVYFKFGDLTNSDSDINSEYAIVEFNALVDNSPNGANTAANNVDGATLSNRTRVYINGTQSGSDSTATNVNVIESKLTLDKQASTISASVDSGNVVTYTVTIKNDSAAGSHTTAFDVHFTDTLPAALVFKQFDSASGGTGLANNSSGNNIDFTLTSVAVGETVTIVYEATLSTTASSISASEAIANQAQVTWTSLPGSNGTSPNGTGSTVPGASGVTNGERNGSGGVVNTYSATASKTLTVAAPTISKLAPSPSTYAIGATVDYYILVSLPEGLTPSLVVHDQLPAGLGYVSDKVITLVSDADNPPAADSRHLSQDYNGSFTTPGTCTNAASNPCAAGDTNQTLDFTFGDTTTTGSGPAEGTTNNQFLLLVRAQVLNVAANQPGTTLTNTATLDYLVGVTTTTVQGGSQTVTVVGPYLTLDKQATTLSASPDAGDTITYTITIQAPTGANRSNAYDVHYYDTLPSGVVTLDSGSVTVTGAGSYSDNSNYATNQIDVTIDEIDITQSVTIKYTATIQISVTPGTTINNTGEVEWTSLAGTVSGERTGADKNSGGVNDYYQSSTATVTSLTITAQKSIVGSSQSFTSIAGDNLSADAAIGEVLRYRLSVILPEGTSPGFQLQDTLPSGFSYVGNPKLSFVTDTPIGVDASHSDLSGADNSAVPPTFDFPSSYVTTAGQNVTFDLGDLVNNDSDANDELVVLDFDVLVNNDTNNDAFGSPAQLTKINNFNVAVSGSTAGTSNDVTATIVESKLDITKDASDVNPGPGEEVTYTLTITHDAASTTNAYDVEVADNLPSNLTLDLSSVQVTPTGWSPTVANNSSGNKVDVGFDSIPLGDSVTITYKATVGASVTSGTTIDNTANLTWTSLPGTDTNERTGSGTGANNYLNSASVSLSVVRGLTKTIDSTSVPNGGTPPTLPNVYIGETLTYKLVLSLPPGTASGMTVADTLDQGLAFIGCQSLTTGPDITTSLAGGFASFCQPAASSTTPPPAPPVISTYPTSSADSADPGRKMFFDLGDVTNAGASDEEITILYQVVVLNVKGNVTGTTLHNNVEWDWTSGTTANSYAATASSVTVKEAKLSIQKTVDPKVAPIGSTVDFTMDVSHTSASQADAYDVLVTDQIPAGLAIVSSTVNVTGSSSLPTPVVNIASSKLTVYWKTFPLGSTAKITFSAKFVGPSPTVNNSTVQWSSVQIDPLPQFTAQSLFNSTSTERAYRPSSQDVNDYVSTGAATLTAPKKLPKTGFAPGVQTILPVQPPDKAYDPMDDMWLEIPALKLKMPIIGVPASADGWDLTWLSNQAGYLEGTTYPTHVGTTALTGHVYLADGTPGPFLHLGDLKWGDQVILHAYGQEYVYEVRTNQVVLPTDMSVFKNDGYTWLTLLTCKEYIPSLNSYDYRIAVRAVLIKVETDPSVTPTPTP